MPAHWIQVRTSFLCCRAKENTASFPNTSNTFSSSKEKHSGSPTKKQHQKNQETVKWSQVSDYFPNLWLCSLSCPLKNRQICYQEITKPVLYHSHTHGKKMDYNTQIRSEYQEVVHYSDFLTVDDYDYNEVTLYVMVVVWFSPKSNMSKEIGLSVLPRNKEIIL